MRCLTSDGSENMDYPVAIDGRERAIERTWAGIEHWRLSSFRLTVLVATLVALGLVMVASALGGAAAGTSAVVGAALKRLLWVTVGAAAFFVGSCVNYQVWRRHHVAILGLAFLGLIVVLLPAVGSQVYGARRWIRLGRLVGVQPSEFAKVALCIWLAAYCERNAERMGTFAAGFVLPLSVVALASMLVLAEPDFGTAALFGVTAGMVLLVCGARLRFFVLCGAAMIPLLEKLVLGCPYRHARIMMFLNPWRDPQGAGYQLIQSKIALGSGGWFGRGLGVGRQKLGFLPGANNDFIFSTIGEELGFIGSLAVVALFGFILWEGLKVALRARDRFGFALAFGFCSLISLQAALNMAVASGSVPTKGLSLPFVSAGGSSLLFSMFAAGVLVNIARSTESGAQQQLTPWYCDVPAYERALADALCGLGRLVKKRFSSLVR